MSLEDNITRLKNELPSNVKLVAVSKFFPSSEIMKAYDAGQRLFGESYPQELAAKVGELPSDIKWHFIGHLQTNKIKLVLPHISLLESVDSEHLLAAVQKWAHNEGRKVDVLLEMHLGAEVTKFGMDETQIRKIIASKDNYPDIRICGLMGMATNTDDINIIREDFRRISVLFREIKSSGALPDTFDELSIGMSGDYRTALEFGATIVRIGSLIFGQRHYK